MTTTVTIQLTHLHEGKVAEVYHANPKSGARHSHRPIASLSTVGQTYTGVCTDGATLVVVEADKPAE